MLPAGVAAESSQLNADGAYLLDNGRLFLLWLGHSISRDFVAQVRCCWCKLPEISQVQLEN